MITTVSADPPFIHRLSYGIVFQAETELLLAQDDWIHTFEISLPSKIDIFPITGCNHDKDTCIIISQVLSHSRSLFNTATLDDVNLLVKHINALKQNTNKIMTSIQQHEEHLSSIIKTSDERLTNMKDGIQQNHIAITHIHTQLQGSFKTIEQSIISMNQLITKQTKNHKNYTPC